MKSCLNLRRTIPNIRFSVPRPHFQFLGSIGIAMLSGCDLESPSIRPDWQQEEHAVCPHLVADIPDRHELLDISGYDGVTANYWELRKIDDSTLLVKHSDPISQITELNLPSPTLSQAYFKEAPDPNQTFLWIETEEGVYLYHFERGKGVIANEKIKHNSVESNWTHRLVWLENQPYIFSLELSFLGIRAPIHLAKLRPDLSVERNWNTSFCLIEFEEKCNDDDDDSSDVESSISSVLSSAIPSQVSPSSNTSRLSIGVEVVSQFEFAEDKLLRHHSGHSDSSTISRGELSKNDRNVELRSNIYVLRYYNEQSGLKYRTVHAFSRDAATFKLEPDNLVEISHSPWATYILAPNPMQPHKTGLAHVPNTSNTAIYHTYPFESASHLIQRENGSIIGNLRNGRFSYSRIKNNPVLGSIQLDSANEDTFTTVGAGLVLIPGDDNRSKLISLNCNSQPQSPAEP